MAVCSLYTDDELVQKLKDLDSELDSAISSSELDTGQSRHQIKMSIRTLREQYEKYKAMLMRQNPTLYRCTFGHSVIKFERGF